ncbi:MAG TPA: helix-turn-helix domain-containing protein [Solirubrobacterales bacterium]|nr:helix-turn-helix domain-containing protein [Solirubrobacterales bacterium]
MREARRRHGVSQKRLAARAGTTQSAISRIEKDRISPTFETLHELLYLLGEDLSVSSDVRDSGVDRTLNQGTLELEPEDRVKKSLHFAETIRELRGKNPVRLRTETSVMRNDLGPPLELSPLFRALVGHRADFVVIGGVAGGFHGTSYPTYDLDIAYERGEASLERMARALRELEVTLRGAPADLPFRPDAEALANGANFTFETPFGRFDLLGELTGVRDYETLKRDAESASFEGIRIRFASIDHLVAMKRAANRTKDKLMLEEYIVIAEERQRAS